MPNVFPTAPARAAAALVCAALLLPTAARAQTSPDSAAQTTTRRDSTRARRLASVTVSGARQKGYAVRRTTTATRTDTPLRDTPQAVTVVTRALIADQAMQGMGDVVRYVPGITMGQGEGHRDAPTIRGNSSTADFFVDGVRDDVQYYRDLYNTERVEALKGSNAMIFGRGGGGGVINRVTKQADWAPARAFTAQGGSFDQRRGTVDVGQGAGPVAARLNGLYEDSRGFRQQTHLRRSGVNPTVALAAGARTMVRVGYEHFEDRRVVDRGIPSFQGRPSPTDVTTFFGDPDVNHARVQVDAADALLTHEAPGGLGVRNRTRWAAYDKFYQNVVPGAVDAAGARVSLSAYNNATGRHNLFNQTDLTYAARTGPVRHTLLAGAEFGRQRTANFRETGYFGADTSTSTITLVPFDAPTVAAPVTFRQGATDANNFVTADVAALYAQDQVALSPRWQAIGGVRVDRFALRLDNRRDGSTLRRTDRLVSPRGGLVFKPAEPVSVYSTVSVSYLPSAGDQFASLTATSQALEPERFTNREAGVKWDARPNLALSAAAYRLDRTHTAAPDPANPAVTVQTGSARTTGVELGATGDVASGWQVAGGFVQQRAVLTGTTTAAKAGATVPLVPRRSASLWNRVRLTPALGVGLGVVRQGRMYAAVDNTVTLPAFTRYDAAAFLGLGRGVRAQVNVENLFDARYYATSQGNNNILPGATRTVRLTLATGVP